jgi:thiol-disulfide isomerase/thioredoxin
MINFFASWCDPCREEMPLINELAAQSENDGYSVLAIAVEDSRAAVTQYAKESKLVFPVALGLEQYGEAGLSDLWPAGDLLY